MFYDLFFTDLLTTGLTFLVINGIEYVLHQMSHSPKLGGHIYKWHKIHHKVYHRNRLVSKDYIYETNDNIYLRYIVFIIVTLYFLLMLSIDNTSTELI